MKIIPYAHQSIDKNDIKRVDDTLNSQWITQGPKIKEFEGYLCEYTGAKFAVAVSSGTAALHIACLAAGINSEDEVITSPLTFVASANCVLYCKGRPVFVDIEEDTLNISRAKIEKKLNKNTKAIIPVNFAGHPCELAEIRDIARKHNLIVIEDAAHALGAEYKGSKIGSCKYSDMAIFSFHPAKSITTGEGGAILTNNKELYDRLLLYRNHGITKDNFKGPSDGDWYYEMQCLGYNYRMTDIQAALGISQIKRLDKFIKARRKIVDYYNKAFKDNRFFDAPIEKTYARSSWHLYVIKLKDRYKGRRRDIFSSLRNSGIGVQVHYIPVYWQPYYKGLGYERGLCPCAEDYYSRLISLPLYPGLSLKQVNFVIKTLLKIMRSHEC